MKEQTPITAEEFVDDYTKQNGTGILMREETINLLEQYAQAKVLEALEVVKTLTDNNVSVTSEHIDNLIRSKTKV